MQEITKQVADIRVNTEGLASGFNAFEGRYDEDRRNDAASRQQMEDLIRANHANMLGELSAKSINWGESLHSTGRGIHEHLYAIQEEQHIPNFILRRTRDWYRGIGFMVGAPPPWQPTFVPDPDGDDRFGMERSLGDRRAHRRSDRHSDVVRNHLGASNMDTTDPDAYYRPETLASSESSASASNDPSYDPRRDKGKKKRRH